MNEIKINKDKLRINTFITFIKKLMNFKINLKKSLLNKKKNNKI